MIEIIIERWTSPDGSTDFMWPVWQNGNRVQISGTYPTSDTAEADAFEFCTETLNRPPDRVTRL
tara:strand:- start:2250 stop:2441 length:192 start_codon:yes stop_codon:yes gene_type:complete